jgi:hypothetical protein
VRADLKRLRGPAALHGAGAVALRRELVLALHREGNPRTAAREQQMLVNDRERYLGENSAQVALHRLDLAELLAEIGNRHALGAFNRAIAILARAHGENSRQVEEARQRRSRALPRRS